MCKYLDQYGYQPVVLDNLVYGHRKAVRWGPFYKGSLDNPTLLKQIFEQHNISAAMHFAAFAMWVNRSRTPPFIIKTTLPPQLPCFKP